MYINMFLACQPQSKVTIKLNFYNSNFKKCRGNCQNWRRQLLRSTAIFNAIAVDWFQGNSRPGSVTVWWYEEDVFIAQTNEEDVLLRMDKMFQKNIYCMVVMFL